MGRIFSNSSIQIVVILMLIQAFVPTVWGDPIPTSYNSSGMIIPFQDSNITFEREIVNITIGHTVTQGIHSLAFINCTFYLRNSEDKLRNMPLAFPSQWDGGPYIYIDGGEIPESSQTFVLKPMDYTENNIRFYNQYGIKTLNLSEINTSFSKEGWDYLTLFNMSMEPNEKKTVNIQYNDVLGTGDGPFEFRYLMTTGSYWNQPIDIEVNLLIDPEVKNADIEPGTERFGGKIHTILPTPDKIDVDDGLFRAHWNYTAIPDEDIVVQYSLRKKPGWNVPDDISVENGNAGAISKIGEYAPYIIGLLIIFATFNYLRRR